MDNNIDSVQSQQSDLVQIKDLIQLCLSKWYWFVLSVVICCAIGAFYILRTPPSYSRSTEIMIKNDSRTRTLSKEFDVPDMALLNTNSNVDNEIIVIKSPAIIEEVVRRMNLNINYRKKGTFHDVTLYGKTLPAYVSFCDLGDEESASLKVSLLEGGKVNLSEFASASVDLDKSSAVTGALSDTLSTPLGRIIVTPAEDFDSAVARDIFVTKSGIHSTTDRYTAGVSASLNNKLADIITLSFKDVSPQRAEDFLNAIIDVYNEKWVVDKNAIATSTSLFIDERLAVIENDLGDVDTDISQYKSDNMLPDVSATTSMYLSQSSEANRALLDLENQIYSTQYIRGYISTEANKFQLLPGGSGISNSVIEAQIKEYNDQMLKRNNLVANSSTSNPLVMDMDVTLETIRGAVIQSLDNQLVSLNQQKRNVQQRENRSNARIQANPTQAKYLLSVERKQKVMESLYLYLLQQREQNELSQAFTAYNTRIITPPRGSLFPVAPKKSQIMLIALLIGLLIPAAILYIKEATNTRIRGKKDLESVTIPFVGEIPMVEMDKKKAAEGDAGILVKAGKRDVANEAFRVMRTNIDFMSKKDRNSNIMMVTSFNPGSGKSFTSVNLAVSFAIKGKKILVIDGDLRHASMSSFFGKPEKGISSYLSGDTSDLSSIIYPSETYPTLSVIPVGVVPPNPTELLEDPRFGQMLESLRSQFDYIFIDCPPINMMADAQIVGDLVDRTIFVVRAGLLEKAMIPELEKLYTDHKFKNMCLVLNGTAVMSSKYGYNYGTKYGYGYGYSYNYGSESGS